MHRVRRSGGSLTVTAESTNCLVDSLAGMPTQSSPAHRTAQVPVSHHAIATWCVALSQGTTPIEWHDLRAPLAMLQTWTMPVDPTALQQASLHARVRQLATRCGLTAIVATDYDLEALGEVRPGDLLVERSWIDSVSPLKRSRLGRGHFVTYRFEYSNQAGDPVGRLRTTSFYFAPSDVKPGSSVSETGHAPTASSPVNLSPHGEALEVPLTRSLIVAASFASRDHEPVHHDHEAARAQGLPDIIIGIITTAGLVGRFAMDLSTTDRQPRRLVLRLAAPAHPGDVLSFTGHVERNPASSVVQVTGTTERGPHVFATVEFAAPGTP